MADGPNLVDMSLSAAAKALEPVLRYATRVYRERQAAHVPSSGQSDLLDQSLDETLGRLVKGFQDQSWWQSLLDAVEQPFVAPDFLRISTLQDWLSYRSVQEDLKAEARQQILRSETNEPSRQVRLRAAYAEITGEREELAAGPINVVVSVLVAGYVASLSSQLKPLAAIIQASGADTKEDLARIENKIDVLAPKLARSEDKIVTKAHTEIATERLKRVIKCRSFSGKQSRANILILHHDVTEGDLRYVESNLKARIMYWAARLHSGSRDTLHVAEELLERLRAEAPEFDCRIPESLILETNRKVEEALGLVAQIDDADGRATAFRILRSAQGTSTALEWFQEHEGTDDEDFLSPLGWFNVVVSFCESNRWPEAATIVARLEPLWMDWPDLAFLDGVINAALLLPNELRIHALKMNVFHSLMRPRYGVTEAKMRARAIVSFTRSAELLEALGDEGKLRAEMAREWILWLRLTDPDPEIENRARSEVSEGMKTAKRAIDLLPFASLFGIDFDPEPIRRYLSHRSKLGTLEPAEVFAEMTLAEKGMTKNQFAEFLEREAERLSRDIPKAAIIGKLVETLVNLEQAGKADDVLDKNESGFSDNDFERLKALVAAKRGEDPRVELERLYTETHSLIDLKNLIRHLSKIRDWSALRPLLEELFRVERNPENAKILVQCYKNITSVGARGLSNFFESEPEVETWSDDLAAERAWVLFEIGRLKPAKNILARLLSSRRDINDTHLDINIAIKSGEWERLSTIVEREWTYRNELSPSLLLRLATIAAEADLTPIRTLELAKLAARKAPEDPQVLMSAYILLVQVGREEESDPRWLPHAVELSDEEGPIEKVSIKTIAEELIPANRRRASDINTKLLKGEVPIHVAASILGVPLSRLFIDLPERNEHQVDSRQKVLIPAFSGGRQRQDVFDGAILGVDVTTIMLLGWLDILEDAISGFGHVLISSGTMITLLNERRRVRFHQPSLVHRAEHVRDLIANGRLKIAGEMRKPPDWLVKEAGIELAELLELARSQNSTVIHAGPIYKVGAYMEQEAELKEYETFTYSLQGFLQQMHDDGRLSEDEFQRGTSALRALGFSLPGTGDAHRRATGFLLDDLALTYLGNAGILEAITRSGITLHVHPSTKKDQDILLSASRQGEWLADKLDRIRTILRDLLDSGQIGFLPGTPLRINNDDSNTLTELCKNATDCDVVCIDDRFANKFRLLTDESGSSRPLICTLDLLHRLVIRARISDSRRIALEDRLRAGGISLIDIDESQVFGLLQRAKIDVSGDLVESAELRNIRQYLGRLRALEMVQVPIEAPFLERLLHTSVRLIRKVWEDAALEKERSIALSRWIVRNIHPNPVDWVPSLRESSRAEQSDIAIASYLKPLVSPLINATSKRSRLYAEWLDREIIAPLRSSNPKIIQLIVAMCKKQIEELGKEIDTDKTYDSSQPSPV